MDGLGFLGRTSADQDIYIITGDSGNGITHATIGAMIVTDQILGRANEWSDLYDPARITLRSSMTYMKENANVAAQYADWFTASGAKDPEDLTPGEGAIFQRGLGKMAVYKDTIGQLHYMSASCPHLAGVVQWNSAEKSWDCPCHGSRFDCHGKVIEGPAVSSLKPVDVAELPPANPIPVGVNIIPSDLPP